MALIKLLIITFPVFLCCNKYVIEEKQFGLEETISYKIISRIDTVKYGEGFIKKATIKREATNEDKMH